MKTATRPEEQSSRAHGQSTTVTICGHQMLIVEYQGKRVVTLAMIDNVHERPEGTARKRFNDNKKRLTEGKHFFELTASEIRTQSLTNIFPSRTTKGILLTEYGYMLLVKSLTDDLAWEVQEQLVDGYFRSRIEAQFIAIPTYPEVLRLYADQLEETQRVVAERDHAIATKAQIGSKREASAMAKASLLSRENNALREGLGHNQKHATVIAVERATKQKLPKTAYAPLRRWCKANGIEAIDVPDERYGTVKAWPTGAWMEVYGIDLADLFAARGRA